MAYLQIFAVAAVEVALAARGPGVLDVVVADGLLDHLGLLGGLQRDQVLAMFAADVAGVEPVSLVSRGGPVPPREEVVVAVTEGVRVPHSCRRTEGAAVSRASDTERLI